MPSVGEYDKIPLKDATSQEALKELGEENIDESTSKKFEPIVQAFKDALGDEINDVELSASLSSPIALLGEEHNAMMANLMRQMGQELPKGKKSVQINVNHNIFNKLLQADSTKVKEIAHLLYDSAKLLESGTLDNAKDFSHRLYALIDESLK